MSEKPWPYAELLDEYNKLANTGDRLTRELAEARAERDEAYRIIGTDEDMDHIARVVHDRDAARQALAAAREALQEIASIERTQLQEGNCGQEPEYECYWSVANRARDIAIRALASSPDGQK